MAEWEQPKSSQPLWQESCLSRVLELTGLSPAVNCFPLPECSEKSCSRGGEHRLCARGVRREPQQPGDAAVPGEAGKCFALLCQWFLLCSHPHLGAPAAKVRQVQSPWPQSLSLCPGVTQKLGVAFGESQQMLPGMVWLLKCSFWSSGCSFCLMFP